ncbi:MAG: hypothetical protein K2X82_16755 [Gemmataceae bacterium]|nr:hypothetical protein [Gemmataceae bacterium]
MSARDLLRAAIDRLPDEQVAELYEHACRLEASQPPPETPVDTPDIMEQLRAIKIDGLPADFSENLDDYLYHGKPIDPGS